MKPVLKIPVYRRLLAAYSLNELAYMVGSLALALLVYRRTGSAFGATAFFLFAQFVPALIAPLLVARLDQRRSRSVLPALYWLEAVIFLVLAWLASGAHFTLVLVLALALLDGILAISARALARAATVTVTSGAGLLREGNAVANGAFSVCFMFGPALGGVVVATGGVSAALIADSCLFGLVGLTLATARDLPDPGPAQGPARHRVRSALAYATGQPDIRALFTVCAAGVLFFTISVPIEVVFAQHTLHAGAAGYGAMLSAWGAGALAGAAIYARWRGLPSRELIVLGTGALGVGFLVMGAAPTLTVAIIGAGFAGIGNGIQSVAARTAVQELVEDRWMALMMSLYEAVYQSVPGAGILLGGTITALGSPRVALAVAGVGSLAVAVAAWMLLATVARGSEPQLDGVRPDPAPEPVRAGQRREAAPTPAVRHQ